MNTTERVAPLSLLLVGLQVLGIALLLLPVRNWLHPINVFALFGVLLLLLAVSLALWALISMGVRTFSVFPEPRPEGQLTRGGPYRWVRHPMYSSIVLAALGALLVHQSLWHPIVFIGLLAVLVVKLQREEAALSRQYPDYADYQQHSRHLIPGLW